MLFVGPVRTVFVGGLAPLRCRTINTKPRPPPGFIALRRRAVPGLFSGVGMLDLRLQRGGLHFPSLGLWMDPHESIGQGEAVVVTHAHADHTGNHAEVLLTEATRRLMRARLGGEREEHVLPYHAEVSLRDPRFGRLRDADLALLPAGHVLGSAMAWLKSHGESLLYTGDFKLRHGRSSEPCVPRHADVLVMETTFGRPHYVFPPTDDVLEAIVRFCRDALHHDEVPVLLGYSLGKAQEVLIALAQERLPIMVSDAVERLTRVYEALGHAFPAYAPLVAERAQGHVVIAPPSTHVPALRRRLGPSRVAILTGWALDPGCRFRHQADAAFPLSDHADFSDLMEMVRRVEPRRVLTLHGFAADFAAHLRQQGIEAWALNAHEQLDLDIPAAPPQAPRATGHATPPARAPLLHDPARTNRNPGDFARFADACTSIRSERSTEDKVSILGAFLRTLPPHQLPHVVAWFSGQALPAFDPRPTRVGWTFLRDAACGAIGCSSDSFRGSYLLHSDTAETVADLWRGHAGDARSRPTMDDVTSCLDRLASEPSKECRLRMLAGFMRRCNAHEARHLAKILTGNLRIGLKDGFVEEAIATAFHAEPDAVRRATMLCGDAGHVAQLAREGRLHEAVLTPFRPVRVMLASPEPDPDAVAARIASWTGDPGKGAWAEDKHDGIRCQAHMGHGNARLFSRDLKDLTPSFPEIAAHLAATRRHAILDGEIVAMDGDRPRPFADLQRRLGRMEPDLFMRDEVPVCFVAFDMLWHEGVSVVDQPWSRRRHALESFATLANIRVARGQWVHDAQDLRGAFDAARGLGHEGLVIKDPAAPYQPGRRGIGWVKLKKTMGTLDCVIIGAEQGHGRRSGVLSDFTFAVRDASSGRLHVMGKAYSGLTDAEVQALTHRLLGRVIRKRGSYLEVEPEVVLEIAFDRIQQSSRHDSGLALRFPRIVRLRDDKRVDECDTLQTARAMAEVAPPPR